MEALADLGGRARRTPPLWDPILLFSHTFSPKSAHIGGPRPLTGARPPPTGNPGSATGKCQFLVSVVQFPITEHIL